MIHGTTFDAGTAACAASCGCNSIKRLQALPMMPLESSARAISEIALLNALCVT